MRLLIILLFFICSCNNSNKLKPSDTLFKEEDKNWEELYAIELARALFHEDDIAFYFFWPYYLRERYLNRNKKTPLPKEGGYQHEPQTN